MSENKEIVGSSFNVLLPICSQSKNDVFLNILKSIVARAILNDNLINAFQSGMHGENFSIESEDISIDWKKLNSEPQQIRQSKLLGLWAINFFPSLGKKLLGDGYRAPKRNAVEVIGSSVIEPDSIDGFILPKMKLRIIELNVSESTKAKLKHFVKAPCYIGKNSGIQISRKMKMFNIDKEFHERCWKALKFGEYPVTSDFEVSSL